MQHKLATWAERGQTRRFDRLLRLVANREWLAEAARIVLASRGARTPGIDGMDKQRLQDNLENLLDELRYSFWRARIAHSRSNGSIFRNRMASCARWVFRP